MVTNSYVVPDLHVSYWQIGTQGRRFDTLEQAWELRHLANQEHLPIKGYHETRKLVVEAPARAESWGKRFETLAAEFRALPTNWDSYDGLPISEEALRAARRFLVVVPTSWDLIPLGDGGVQLEWCVSGVEFGITFDPKGTPVQG